MDRTPTNFQAHRRDIELRRNKNAFPQRPVAPWRMVQLKAAMQISEHFTLEELSFSEAATRLGLENTPSAGVIQNLIQTAATMEAIRTLLGAKPIDVHSGYRSPQVNRAVGGVASSAHCRGLACDFVCPAFGTPLEVARAILSSALEYDQLILEYGWVHVGLAPAGMSSRREALTKRSAWTAYECGIKA